MSSQRIGKYACLELERRYLLAQLPPQLTHDAPHWQIVDHYLAGTRMRLRQMTQIPSDMDQSSIYKLTQKFRGPRQDVTQTTITNLYLDEAEYRHLRTLEAYALVKRRYTYVAEGRQYSIDVFDDRHRGLILAEAECETEAEVANLTLPSFAQQEVTQETFFRGGVLASLPEVELRAGLRRWNIG